jgi:hypothetical protein
VGRAVGEHTRLVDDLSMATTIDSKPTLDEELRQPASRSSSPSPLSPSR